MASKKSKQQSKQIKAVDLNYSISLTKQTEKIILFVLIFLPVAFGFYYINHAFSVNHEHGFPLDDPWIHLQFAKNLVDYGSFSYFKNEMVTAGSTSPIYTLMLAVGFIVTNSEMILSYVLGILFMCAGVFFFYKSCNETLKENWLVLGATLIFVSDRWMNFITVTGMETTLFTSLLLGSYYFYMKRKAIPFGILFGLTLWARPDAVAFMGAIAVDYLFALYIKRNNPKSSVELFSKSDLLRALSIFGVIAVIYFAMNMIISGSLLPNTYDAKLTYYSPEFRSRADFLKTEVWQYFTESSYVFLIVPFLLSVIFIFRDVFKKEYNKFLLPLLFILILIFIYWYKLPYAHRFGRYLMPIIPFYILLFAYGLRETIKLFANHLKDVKLMNGLNILILCGAVVYSFVSLNENKNLYREQCAHITQRQVVTAKWLKANTPEGSIIATHDVGAIAFYSERKIVDVAGLVNPEFIKKINDKDFSEFMIAEMKKQNVSYIAFLREWYQVANQKALFTTGDNNFEIMQVFKFEPGKTHILSREVNGGLTYALQLINGKQFQQAINVFNKLIQLDPNSSMTYYMLAYTYSVIGDEKKSETNLKKAIEINPDYHEAVYSLVELYKKQARINEAKEVGEIYLKNNPSDTLVSKSISKISDTLRTK